VIICINNTKLLVHIECDIIKPIQNADGRDTVDINVEEWYQSHPWHATINEDHLPRVAMANPVIQVEFNPGMYKLIDGHHRMELAYRKGITKVESYTLSVEQWIPYFADVMGYEAFVDYLNSKVEITL